MGRDLAAEPAPDARSLAASRQWTSFGQAHGPEHGRAEDAEQGGSQGQRGGQRHGQADGDGRPARTHLGELGEGHQSQAANHRAGAGRQGAAHRADALRQGVGRPLGPAARTSR